MDAWRRTSRATESMLHTPPPPSTTRQTAGTDWLLCHPQFSGEAPPPSCRCSPSRPPAPRRSSHLARAGHPSPQRSFCEGGTNRFHLPRCHVQVSPFPVWAGSSPLPPLGASKFQVPEHRATCPLISTGQDEGLPLSWRDTLAWIKFDASTCPIPPSNEAPRGGEIKLVFHSLFAGTPAPS